MDLQATDTMHLRQPITRTDLTEAQRVMTVSGASSTAGTHGWLLLCSAMTLTTTGVAAAVGEQGSGRWVDSPFAVTVISLAWLVLATAAVISAVKTAAGRRSSWELRVRLWNLAVANRFDYTPEERFGPYQNPFGLRGGESVIVNHLSVTGSQPFDVFNFRWVFDSGRGYRSYSRPEGTLALHVVSSLPSLILSTSRHRPSAAAMRGHVVTRRVESHVSSARFFIHCESNAEDVAERFISPDLLTLLAQSEDPFTVQCEDHVVSFHRRQPFDLTTERAWAEIDSLRRWAAAFSLNGD